MAGDADYPRRQSHRLPEVYYAQTAAYFVTICAYERRCTLGRLVNGQIVLTEFGVQACECWRAIPQHCPNVQLDLHVIMPNHLHGILVLNLPRAAQIAVDADSCPSALPVNLQRIIQSYKAAVTKQARMSGLAGAGPVWQRNYWDHIIRDEHELALIREYIQNNPLSWQLDQENQERSGVNTFYQLLAKQRLRG